MNVEKDWISKLKKLGVNSCDNEGLDQDFINDFDSRFENGLPEDYKSFLLEFGESDFDECVVFPTSGGGVYLGVFLGGSINSAMSDYSERMPDHCIPINDDGSSNLVIMSLHESDYGAIYFQHHSMGIGDKLASDKAWRETLSFLALDFVSFIAGLGIEN